jgi:hypothetical protein
MTTLDEAVEAIKLSVLEMERICIADYPTFYPVSVPVWIYWQQDPIYWTNRITGLTSPAEGVWDLRINMRLNLAHISQVNAQVNVTGTETPQDKSWSFIPKTIQYFRDHKNLVYDRIAAVERVNTKFVDPVGITIDNPTGMDVIYDQYKDITYLVADFDLLVPIEL